MTPATPAPTDDRARELREALVAMARGTRDLAEEAAAVALHFRPEFDACRGADGNFPDEATALRARRLYCFVVDRERDAKRLGDEATTLEQAAATITDLRRQVEEAKDELWAVKCAAAGGEDAPGAANMVTAEDVRRWRDEDSQQARSAWSRADRAEAERDALAAMAGTGFGEWAEALAKAGMRNVYEAASSPVNFSSLVFCWLENMASQYEYKYYLAQRTGDYDDRSRVAIEFFNLIKYQLADIDKSRSAALATAEARARAAESREATAVARAERLEADLAALRAGGHQ